MSAKNEIVKLFSANALEQSLTIFEEIESSKAAWVRGLLAELEG